MLGAIYASVTFAEATAIVTLCFLFYTIAGISQNAVVPVAFEYALELTFPEPEAVTSGSLIFGANTVSFVLLSVASAILGEEPTKGRSQAVLCMLLAFSVAGALCVIMVKGTLRRLVAESAFGSPASAGSPGEFQTAAAGAAGGEVSMTTFRGYKSTGDTSAAAVVGATAKPVAS